MIDPALDEIMEKVDCRYSLVAVVSKRARQIVDDPTKAADIDVKPVSSAVDDLMCGRIEYTKGDDAPAR